MGKRFVSPVGLASLAAAVRGVVLPPRAGILSLMWRYHVLPKLVFAARAQHAGGRWMAGWKAWGLVVAAVLDHGGGCSRSHWCWWNKGCDCRRRSACCSWATNWRK